MSERRQAISLANEPGLVRLIMLGRNTAGLGRRLSLALSILAAISLWFFFIKMPGWKPPTGEELDYSTYFHWLLLIYLALQLILLIPTSAGGSRGEVWLDTFASLVPFVLIVYVLVLHWGQYETLLLEQLRYAKSTAGVMGIDFFVNFGVAIATQRHAWSIHT